MPKRKPKMITAKGRGKTWRRSLEAAEKRVRDYEEYFISRNGGWFRPKAHGYTIELGEAGLFLGTEARGYLNAEGVQLVPKSMMVQRIRKDAVTHLSIASRLMEMISSI